MPPFLTSCPNCGHELVVVDTTNNPDWAPFLCAVTCSRGWWPSELLPAARRAWHPETRSHTDLAVLMAALGDRDTALAAWRARRGG